MNMMLKEAIQVALELCGLCGIVWILMVATLLYGDEDRQYHLAITIITSDGGHSSVNVESS